MKERQREIFDREIKMSEKKNSVKEQCEKNRWRVGKIDNG